MKETCKKSRYWLDYKEAFIKTKAKHTLIWALACFPFALVVGIILGANLFPITKEIEVKKYECISELVCDKKETKIEYIYGWCETNQTK